jgi:nucleolar GTP-binding protein
MHETRSRSLSRPATKRKREDSEGTVRSSSKVPRDKSGVRDVAMAQKARKINKMGQRKNNLAAKTGEADRRIHVKKPKHLCKLLVLNIVIFYFVVLFIVAGKRTIGKTDRR